MDYLPCNPFISHLTTPFPSHGLKSISDNFFKQNILETLDYFWKLTMANKFKESVVLVLTFYIKQLCLCTVTIDMKFQG